MPDIDDNTPAGENRNTMTGHVRILVQARDVGKLVAGGGIWHAISSAAAVIAVIALIAFSILNRPPAGHPDGQEVAGPPSAVPTIAAVSCRQSGWVVPDHGQRSIPYYPGQDQEPAGAVLSSGGNVSITLQGTSDHPVILQQATVDVVRRLPPMAGIYLPAGCQGELTPRQYTLNLDSPMPRIVLQPHNGSFPYKVTINDPEVLVITPSVTTGEVEWRLYLTWTSGTDRGTLVIPEPTEPPFETTATGASRKFCTSFSGWTPCPPGQRS